MWGWIAYVLLASAAAAYGVGATMFTLGSAVAATGVEMMWTGAEGTRRDVLPVGIADELSQGDHLTSAWQVFGPWRWA